MSSFWPLFAANLVMTTLMAFAVALAGWWTPLRGHPRLRHALWLLVLAKLLTPPVCQWPVLPSGISEAGINTDRGESSTAETLPRIAASSPQLPSARARGGAEREIASSAKSVRATLQSAIPAVRAPPTGSLSLPLLAIAVLPAGLLLARCLWETRRIGRLVAQAAAADERLTRVTNDACRRMGLTTRPEIRVVTGRLMPFLWIRLGRPTIVLPAPLVERLGDDQVECIICHELAHFIRRDHWSNIFALAVAAGYWWFPVAWWARRALLASQEQCCDALVIVAGGVPRRRYAEALFKTIEFINDERLLLPALASGFGRVSTVRRRFEMIASQRISPRFPIVSAAVSLLVVGAFFSLPVRGQGVSGTADEQREATSANVAAPRPGAPDGPGGPGPGGLLPGKSNEISVPVVEKRELKYRSAEVTVDASKHYLFIGQQAATGQGALRLDLERGKTYTVSAAGEAFMSAQTGADADPFPGVVFYYSTDEEDGYAVRYVVLKAGDSVTFRAPWLISQSDEVFALAFFLDAWPGSENHGSYTLTFQRDDETRPFHLNSTDAGSSASKIAVSPPRSVPVLGQMPFVGRLFTTGENSSTSRSEGPQKLGAPIENESRSSLNVKFVQERTDGPAVSPQTLALIAQDGKVIGIEGTPDETFHHVIYRSLRRGRYQLEVTLADGQKAVRSLVIRDEKPQQVTVICPRPRPMATVLVTMPPLPEDLRQAETYCQYSIAPQPVLLDGLAWQPQPQYRQTLAFDPNTGEAISVSEDGKYPTDLLNARPEDRVVFMPEGPAKARFSLGLGAGTVQYPPQGAAVLPPLTPGENRWTIELPEEFWIHARRTLPIHGRR